MTKEINLIPAPSRSHLTDSIERLVKTDSVEDAWAVHCTAMTAYGFDRLFYGFTRFISHSGFGSSDDMLLLSSMPENYMEQFIKAEMYKDAPMTTWARENVGAMSWAWVRENLDDLTPKQTAVLEFNRRFGLTAGYTIAFKDALTRNKGAIALTSDRGLTQADLDAVWKKYGRDINTLNQVSHLKFTSLPLPKSRHRLSDRQREVLEWVGDGKTIQDICVILGLTRATVEKHLRKARETLDVETTAQAVHKASVQNQMFIVKA